MLDCYFPVCPISCYSENRIEQKELIGMIASNFLEYLVSCCSKQCSKGQNTQYTCLLLVFACTTCILLSLEG